MPTPGQFTYPLQFRDTWYAKAPPWLSTGQAERYMYTLQTATDALVEKASQAIAIRFPGCGDPSQLPYLAHDRQLVQGPGELNAAFVVRLQNAFTFWNQAGSRYCVAEALQSFLVNLLPGVPGTRPLFALVTGSYPTVATWLTQYVGDPIGYGTPTLQTVLPSNFDWDGGAQRWRAWCVIYGHRVVVSSGASASIGTGYGPLSGSGHNVNGVWVPNTIATTLQVAFFNVAGLTGLTSGNVGDWLTITGSANPTNNGTFQIVQVVSGTECVIANPGGVAGDAGPLAWTLQHYPTFAPGLAWGAPGVNFGAGEANPAQVPADTGIHVGGVWQPTFLAAAGQSPTYAWGLSMSAQFVQSIRNILSIYKSGTTYYVSIVFAFGGNAGVAGDEYSPNSAPGAGNPGGTFGGVGKNVGGVWVPSRLLAQAADAYCTGTGASQGCTVPNVG